MFKLASKSRQRECVLLLREAGRAFDSRQSDMNQTAVYVTTNASISIMRTRVATVIS